MIAFDNGPDGGDYVRYIDDLMKRAAIAASAGTLGSMDGGTAVSTTRTRVAAIDESKRPSPAARPQDRTADLVATTGWAPADTGTARRSMADSGQTTGFVAPTASTRSASAAAAIASALMSGEVGRAALSTHAKVGLAAIAFGLVLVAVGLFWVPLNLIFLVAGGAVIVWAVRMMRDAKASLLVRPPGAG